MRSMCSVTVKSLSNKKKMPYIMVMGNISTPHLSKDEGSIVYGLKTEERFELVKGMNSSFGKVVASLSDRQHTVEVLQKGLTLALVNTIHDLLGYDVVSHAMIMTNANRDLASFTMYKKSSSNSHGQTHSHGQSHARGHTSSHKSDTHKSVVTL